MIRLCRENNLSAPTFEMGPRSCCVSLLRPGRRPQIITDDDTAEKTGQKTVEKIIEAIRDNPQITQKKLINATGLTRRGIEWNLQQLKAKGVIRRVGPDKGGHWEVLP